MIYKIKNNYENFYSFLIKNAELGSKMPNYSPRFQAESRIDNWVKSNGSFYASSNYSSDKVAIPDITTWLSGLLVLNMKAYECLRGPLEKSGEFLPISVESIDYYVFNTLKVIPDEGVDKSNAKPDPDIQGSLVDVVFYESKLDSCPLFKSSIDHYLYSYCTEEFKKITAENGLQGLEFIKY